MTSYRWEASAERSWDDLEEDSSGLLHDAQAAAHYKTQRLEYASRSAKRRMVRYMVLVVDLSLGLDPKLNTELRPNPFTVFRRLVEMFINDFFEKNPVSQLGIVVTRDKHAHLVSHIGGSPKQHVAKMEKEWSENPSGQPTLENSLRIAQQALLGTPTYGSREIVVLFGSAHTVDPGDIHEAITDLRSHGIRSSVVGVGAALHICQVLANQTQGLYHVGGNALELEQLVLFHATPPPLTVQMLRDQPAELIQMGFPQFRETEVPTLSATSLEFSSAGYLCPRCMAHLEELPSTCPVCQLSNVASPQLARSFHHLFPVPLFVEVTPPDDIAAEAIHCAGCLKFISARDMRFRCPRSSAAASAANPAPEKVYCTSCDVFIHDVLHNQLGDE